MAKVKVPLSSLLYGTPASKVSTCCSGMYERFVIGHRSCALLASNVHHRSHEVTASCSASLKSTEL